MLYHAIVGQDDCDAQNLHSYTFLLHQWSQSDMFDFSEELIENLCAPAAKERNSFCLQENDGCSVQYAPTKQSGLPIVLLFGHEDL